MFQFKADIVRRRRFSKTALLVGMVAAALLGYTSITYVERGMVPAFETLIDQIGLHDYTNLTYICLFAFLLLATIPAFYNIFKKKVLVGGMVLFDEEKLEIKKGRQHFVIPEKELSQLNFELKKLPTPEKVAKKKPFGGSYMKIPTTKGIFKCELDINSRKSRKELENIIEFLKIEHDVNVAVKEIK
jgi:hypothetical protein